MAKTFSFVLDSFGITDTRALHNDTDYVSFTLVVDPQGGNGTPQTVTKAMGDVNNGVHTVNLSFQNVPVNPTDTVKINYLIVNSGHTNPSEVESLLESAGQKLLTAAGTFVGSLLPVPLLGPGLGAFATWLGGLIVSIINANCDGPVAAEQVSFTFADLVAKTAQRPFFQHTPHPGTDSATGCGGNSAYTVNWHMFDTAVVASIIVPDVSGLTQKQAAQAVTAVGLVPAFVMGQTHGRPTSVSSQTPQAGALAFAGDKVTMVLTANDL